MPSAADGGGLAALRLLKSTEPTLYLTPSPELSKAARLASEYLFASLNPHAPKCPFSQLLTEGFDAEQIWQQIDLQAQPLLPTLRRQVRNFEKNPLEIKKQFDLDGGNGKEGILLADGKSKRNVESESEDFDDDDDEEEEEEGGDDDEEKEGEGSGDDDEDMENDEGENANGVEDEFLKINELEEFLVEDEEREYGLKKDKKENKRKRGEVDDEDDEDEEVDEDDDEDEDDELGLMGLEDDDDDDGSDIEKARYEDFFTSTKKISQKKKPKYDDDESDDMDSDDVDNQNKQTTHAKELGELRAKVEEMEKENKQGKTKQSLSTHEKELEKLRAQIEEMERTNMEPKSWTMQGEVTAAKRPKNSALEVDLDFEHNVRPVPQTTEESTASLEEMIKKRIIEGRFDDVQRPLTSFAKAPREKKELDENKSKKGLAELYEDEYAQKTGLVSTALTFSDELKKEASMLFKKICVKLDALSHFHFAPKPVIEDMSIQANVPALAMEEVAPLAVSDAAMLAPEEVFSSKGDIKEDKELTKADRKRRRAKKKRQFKAESAKRDAVKAQLSTLKKPDSVAGNGES